MIKFNASKFSSVFASVATLANNAFVNSEESVTEEEKQQLFLFLYHVDLLCDSIELLKTKSRVSLFKTVLSKGLSGNGACPNSVVVAELDALQACIVEELKERKFAFILTEKVKFFEQDHLFGEAVLKAFPEANADIKDAGDCLAVDLHTAAVFHFMRAANIGARKLAQSLGIERIGKKELEYCRDESIFKEIEQQVDRKLNSVNAPTTARDESWERELAYFRGLLVDLRYFKDVVRDPVAHARKSYTEEGALSVYGHVRDFMQRLATKVSE